MKTIYKVLIAGVIGLAAAWVCYQVFHLEQEMATLATVLVALAAFAVCDKIKTKK